MLKGGAKRIFNAGGWIGVGYEQGKCHNPCSISLASEIVNFVEFIKYVVQGDD